MSELNEQLKKKSTEGEKNVILLEKLRVKQERIQELESQLAKIERQTSSERQTNEKQAHETWLQTRKIERELTSAKDRLTEIQSNLESVQIENRLLKQNIHQLQANSQMKPANPSIIIKPKIVFKYSFDVSFLNKKPLSRINFK